MQDSRSHKKRLVSIQIQEILLLKIMAMLKESIDKKQVS